MNLIEDGTVPVDALPVAALREHLRLGTGFGADGLQDGLLEGYLRAAIAAIEGRIGKALIARGFRLRVHGWRDAMCQPLPVAPVSSIASLSVAGADVPVAAWWLAEDMHRPCLVARSALPTIPEGGAAEIAFVAGFGNWNDVPPDLRQAVMMLAAEYYELRHQAEARVSALPVQVAQLLERWRNVRLLGGRAWTAR